MKFSNTTKVPAAWTLGFRRDGRELLIVAAKATYDLPKDGSSATLSGKQVPLVLADEFYGSADDSAPRCETDFAHGKPACDVLLIGSAHAPGGRPTDRCEVALQVGTMLKRFTVVGDRAWRKHLSGISASAPRLFKTQRITYGVAFGGTDRTRDGRCDAYATNPVGVGYWRHTEHIDGKPLPNTEESGRSVESPSDRYVPKSLGPIGRSWSPRASFAGTYDQHWIENDAPFWPKDFDERYFQAAPADQVIPFPTGNELVRMCNLSASGPREFPLPAPVLPVTYTMHRHPDINQLANIDTVVIEPDDSRLTLTWRSTLALPSSIFDVDEVIVGNMPAAWHRTRRFPDKTYYRGLAELIEARRGALA